MIGDDCKKDISALGIKTIIVNPELLKSGKIIEDLRTMNGL